MIENSRKNDSPISENGKVPTWIWMLALVGMIDALAYSILLLNNVPISNWLPTLIDTGAFVLMVGSQGFSFALLGIALIVVSKSALIKKNLNFYRIIFFNCVAFTIFGIIPLMVFYGSRTGGDYGFGIALLPIFFYPIFNFIRFFILLTATFLIVKSYPPSKNAVIPDSSKEGQTSK